MLKIFEAFAGVGSQAMALRNLGIEYKTVGISEIDKFATQSYELIHGKTKNYGDILKINWQDVDDIDLFTYSFPCQDLSLAGKRKGLEKGSNTRSSLLWECEKAIEIKKPKYLLLENVRGLATKQMMPHFIKWLNILKSYGYKNYVQVLNAKNYGIPQNRDRVFVVSIRNDIEENREVIYQDLFVKYTFKFAEPFDNKKRLKDIVEDSILDKYYLSDKSIKGFNKRKERNDEKAPGFGWQIKINLDKEIARTITVKEGSRNNRTFILENNLKILYSDSKNSQGNRVYSLEGIACNQTAGPRGVTTGLYEINNKIRKLTPLEVWRLMAFDDDDYDKVKPYISDTQLYKQAGNSICVNVLEFIFYELFKNDYKIKRNPYKYYYGGELNE
jgi:DNA (cytosine-5)-methyltransferase 1